MPCRARRPPGPRAGRYGHPASALDCPDAIDEAARQRGTFAVRPQSRNSPPSGSLTAGPETQFQQTTYSRHLHTLANGLEAARNGNVQLEDLQAWLRDQFGDRAVTRSVMAFNRRVGQQVQARQHGYTRSGGLFVPAAPAIIGTGAGLAPIAARAHTNMGERR